ncbi:hypothetical protein C2S52_019531 [Perilla frutescens var. hirtella]|uniref:Spindle and kinetochore-associated protein 3 n=1 Tax=Perilla frutescens var. hirtella TaxID=608512 RepID=A0AAD4P8A4_PERFH|nr:hypothetical protein C2S52_019531 [Perilla frutescens var. hirtella]KAH6806202.1 hypothetical protein C2S51_031033 [Perilla frutescens var. frutescens]KAH6829467.1 hypothetical protein C2S53_011510 [Perilla frutescens var. hirtella]
MEEHIGKLCTTLAKFCNHLQTSCTALKESIDRRPIPLDSASTTFVQSVNRRVSAAGDDLNILESMSFATVSFEELLGHCNEVLKKNRNDISDLQDHLYSSSNYIPRRVVDDYSLDNFSPGSGDGLKRSDDIDLEEDPLLDDSLSLKNFGISDISLATIASQAHNKFEMCELDLEMEAETRDEMSRCEDSKLSLSVSRDDYESLPKHMKGLASWEELQVAVGKMNSCLGSKKTKADTFEQDEIELLELGYKSRSYLLLLIKMNRLRIETSEGIISYRIA